MKLFVVLRLIGNFHNVLLLLLQVIRNDFKLKQVKCFTDSGCCLLQVLTAVKLEQRRKKKLFAKAMARGSNSGKPRGPNDGFSLC